MVNKRRIARMFDCLDRTRQDIEEYRTDLHTRPCIPSPELKATLMDNEARWAENDALLAVSNEFIKFKYAFSDKTPHPPVSSEDAQHE